MRQKPEHGTVSCYNNTRCRCDKCKAAMREYKRKLRGGGTWDELKGPRSAHGTITRYTRWQCRCTPCRVAGNAAQASWRARQPKVPRQPRKPRRETTATRTRRVPVPPGAGWKVRLYGSDENYDRWRRGDVTLDELEEELNE